MSTLPHQAIATFGEAHQILKCIEELQELTIELAESLVPGKLADTCDLFHIIRRAKITVETVKQRMDVHKKEIDVEHLARIVYEVADVAITLDQIMVIFNLESRFEQAVDEKKDRLKKMISEASV